MAKGRAKQFEDDEHIVKDYDPEADGRNGDDESGSDLSGDERAGTEHYETVGKSKLRQKDSVFLGPQYRGSKVSRATLDADEDEDEDEDEEEEEDSGSEEYDDPELADLEADEAEASDSEIESDNALGDSDGEHLKDFTFRGSSKPAKPANKRARAADFMSSSEDEAGGAEVQEEGSSDEDSDLEGLESEETDEDELKGDGLDDLADGLSDLDGESDEDEDEDESEEASDGDEASEDEESDSSGKKKAAPGLVGQTPTSDQPEVDKGVAIQQQRKVYDGLLNLRIRLQKALVAVNTFPLIEDDSETATEPYEAAEEAAVKLLNTISTLKQDFGPNPSAGTKRKREIETSTSTEDIWASIQEDERHLLKSRQDRLEKWSRRVQSVTVTSTPKGLGTRNKTLISNLEDQLTDSDHRLVKRTRVPRSCAPAQAAKRITEDESIYDDADFYQLLLKELVDQRTVDSSGEQASNVPSVMLTAAKDSKLRKNVDRKASKGRKMRFTVHEKVQNFMAPEDRRSWEQGAIDRFFTTLFGQRMELGEDESEDEEMDGTEAQGEGVRLFQ